MSTTFVETVRAPDHLRFAGSRGILRALYVTAPDKRGIAAIGSRIQNTGKHMKSLRQSSPLPRH